MSKRELRERSLRIVAKVNAEKREKGVVAALRDALKEEGMKIGNR